MTRLLCCALLAAGAAAVAETGFHLTREIKIGGEGGWDYITVDAAARRLYVSHATKVEVIDVDSGKTVGQIPDTTGVHGITVAAELGRGFVSNGRSNDVTVFDLKTLAVIGRVKTGENPDAILYERVSGRVFTLNGRSKDATAFDAKTSAVAATIPLGGKPEFSAADGKGKIYVNIEDKSEVVEIDAVKLSATRRYSLAPCEEPSGLAMDVAKRRLFSVCANGIMAVSDPDSGKVLFTPRIGQGPDGAGFDSDLRLAFSSNGEGTLTVVRETSGKWEAVQTVPTKRGARTMTIDPKSHNIYLPAAEYGPMPGGTRGRPPIVPGTFEVLVVGR